jgi:hypothetical protein
VCFKQRLSILGRHLLFLKIYKSLGIVVFSVCLCNFALKGLYHPMFRKDLSNGGNAYWVLTVQHSRYTLITSDSFQQWKMNWENIFMIWIFFLKFAWDFACATGNWAIDWLLCSCSGKSILHCFLSLPSFTFDYLVYVASSPPWLYFFRIDNVTDASMLWKRQLSSRLSCNFFRRWFFFQAIYMQLLV